MPEANKTDNPISAKSKIEEALAVLKALGFPISELSTYCKNFDQVLSEAVTWEAKRSLIPYEVDGIVVKINDLNLAESLGFVGKDPRGATALKFQAQEVSTRLNVKNPE